MTAAPEPVRFTLRDLVERFGGTCGGDLSRRVSAFAPLATASAEHLSFVSAPRYRDGIGASRAAAVLVTEADAQSLAAIGDRLWTCRDPYLQFARIAQHFEAANAVVEAPGRDATAVVAADAVVDADAIIGPQAIIGSGARIGPRVRIGAGSIVGARCVIGADTRVHAGVVIYHGCTIGERGIVHSGAVVGSDGFGFAKDGPRWVKIPQTGAVVIGDDVEIGANTTIDRGALDDTRVGNGVKLDNQIQIAHNVQIGDDTIMAACVGIAGSAVVGKRCMIGGAARIMGHVTIADDTVISTQTFVSRSITRAGQYTGYYPMSEHAVFEKNAAVLRRLDGLRDRVRRLEAIKPDPSESER